MSVPEGRFVYYRLSDQRIETLLRLADELLAETGRRIFECTNYVAGQHDRQQLRKGRELASKKDGQ